MFKLQEPDAALPRLNLPVVSQSVCIGRWVLPGWWVWVVCTDAVLLQLLLFAVRERLPVWLPAPNLVDPELVGAACVAGLLVLTLLLIFHVRRGKCAETRIHADRIELDDGKGGLRVLYWKRVAPSGNGRGDIWLKSIGSGDASHQVICLTYLRNDGKLVEEHLMCSLHPQGRPAPHFTNQAALRRGFVLALQLARPELQVSDEVWSLCEVHPATLRRNVGPKWSFRLGLLACLLLTGWFATQLDIRAAPFLSVLQCVGVLTLLAILLSLALTHLFARQDAPAIIAHRTTALAALARQEGLPWPPSKAAFAGVGEKPSRRTRKA